MRLSTLAISLSAFGLLAACSHKERVVERPVVERQTVIEKPVIVPQPAAGGTAAGTCSWNSVTYSDGALSCQAGKQFRCSNGTWNQATPGGSC
jgi:hypothetical protein